MLQGIWQAFAAALTNLLQGGRIWQAIAIVAVVFFVSRIIIGLANLWRGREGRVFIDMTKLKSLALVVFSFLGVLMAFQLTGGTFVIPALGINVQGGASTINTSGFEALADWGKSLVGTSPSGVPFYGRAVEQLRTGEQLRAFEMPVFIEQKEIVEGREVVTIPMTRTFSAEVVPGAAPTAVFTQATNGTTWIISETAQVVSGTSAIVMDEMELVLNPGITRTAFMGISILQDGTIVEKVIPEPLGEYLENQARLCWGVGHAALDEDSHQGRWFWWSDRGAFVEAATSLALAFDEWGIAPTNALNNCLAMADYHGVVLNFETPAETAESIASRMLPGSQFYYDIELRRAWTAYRRDQAELVFLGRAQGLTADEAIARIDAAEARLIAWNSRLIDLREWASEQGWNVGNVGSLSARIRQLVPGLPVQ